MRLHALLLLLAVAISGCAIAPTTSPLDLDAAHLCKLPYELADPWEPFNRAVYDFNARFDEAIFLPVTRGYQRLLPQPVRTGINNFLGNLSEVGNIVNHSLQGRPGRALHSLGRFAINTTAGIGGLFDPASPLGLEQLPTGFGNTLARWGTASGPYLVLPLAGPSSLRDSSGLLLGAAFSYQVDLAGLYQSDHAWMLGTVFAVDTRAHVDFRYYSSGSPFEYEMMRFLYTNKRMIETGQTLPRTDQCIRPEDPG